METQVGIAVLLAAAVTIAVWYALKSRVVDKRLAEARQTAAEIEQGRDEAEKGRERKLVEAKDQIFAWRTEAERQIRERRRFRSPGKAARPEEDNLQRSEQTLSRKERDCEPR
jgi:hypothetical protein